MNDLNFLIYIVAITFGTGGMIGYCIGYMVGKGV